MPGWVAGATIPAMTPPRAAASPADEVGKLYRQVTAAMVLSLAWCLGLLLVIDPWVTVTKDVAALYGSEVGGFSAFVPVIGIVAGVGVLVWLASLLVVRRLAGRLDSPTRRLLALACSTGMFGAAVMVTTLLYPFVGLGLYNRAETLGLAPAAASVSAAAVVTLVAGITALVTTAVVAGKVPEPTPASTRGRVRPLSPEVGR